MTAFDTTSLAFSYDGLGRRTSRTVGSGRTDYWYDRTGMAQETGAATATYLREMVSFDRDFDKLPAIQRVEP